MSRSHPRSRRHRLTGQRTPSAVVIVLALAAALISALNLWRIGEREDREKHLLLALHRNLRHLRMVARIPRAPWYQQLGTKIASTKVIGAAKQVRVAVSSDCLRDRPRGRCVSPDAALVGPSLP